MNRLNLAALFVLAAGLAGCGAAKDSGDTKDAAKEVQAMAGQGGVQPDPNLPKPINGAPPGGAAPKGKFGLGKPGG